MPQSRLEWARMNLEQVRTQLLDAAAFAKYLPPEQLERAALKIGEGLRIYREETESAQTRVAGGATDLGYRR